MDVSIFTNWEAPGPQTPTPLQREITISQWRISSSPSSEAGKPPPVGLLVGFLVSKIWPSLKRESPVSSIHQACPRSPQSKIHVSPLILSYYGLSYYGSFFLINGKKWFQTPYLIIKWVWTLIQILLTQVPVYLASAFTSRFLQHIEDTRPDFAASWRSAASCKVPAVSGVMAELEDEARTPHDSTALPARPVTASEGRSRGGGNGLIRSRGRGSYANGQGRRSEVCSHCHIQDSEPTCWKKCPEKSPNFQKKGEQ